MSLEFAFAKHRSPEYEETVKLRYKILREPLGLTFTSEQLAAEDTDYHLYTLDEGRLVACLVLSPRSQEAIQMRQVAVDSAVQRSGIGRQMVLFSEEWARKQGYKKMVLHAREHAIPFYLSMSYSLEGAPFTEVGIPHMKMFKLLTTG